MAQRLHDLVKRRDQSLGQPEREHELRTGHEELRGETLEEGSGTLVLHHVLDDSEPGLGVLKVAVLDTGLDDVEGSGDDEGRGRTRDGGDEVLAPGGGVVVLQTESLLGKGGTTEKLLRVSTNVHKPAEAYAEEGAKGETYSEGTRSVTGSSPAPATVQTKALILDDLEETTATESLGVGLALDLEDVEREEDDLADADEGAGSSGHDGLTRGLAEGVGEGLGVVGGQVVTDEGLAAVLVDTLEDLGVIQYAVFSQRATRKGWRTL